MKGNFKRSEKWVYIKCNKCGKKKDLSVKKWDEKVLASGLSEAEFIKIFACMTCTLDKQKPIKEKTDKVIEEKVIKSKSQEKRIAIQKDIKPFTKEVQLGKKPLKNTVSVAQKEKEMEDILAK